MICGVYSAAKCWLLGHGSWSIKLLGWLVPRFKPGETSIIYGKKKGFKHPKATPGGWFPPKQGWSRLFPLTLSNTSRCGTNLSSFRLDPTKTTLCLVSFWVQPKFNWSNYDNQTYSNVNVYKTIAHPSIFWWLKPFVYGEIGVDPMFLFTFSTIICPDASRHNIKPSQMPRTTTQFSSY